MIDLTPLDVRKKRGDFGKGLRGYDPQEVDTFLELVAERLEEVVKENMTLRERAERLAEQVDQQSGREKAVQDALVTAQQLREEMRSSAERETELARREAEAEARRVIDQAESHARELLAEAERVLRDRQEALAELERRRGRFLTGFRQLLERELDMVHVEEGRSPLKDVPIDLDLRGGRADEPETPVDLELGSAVADDPDVAPARVDDGAEWLEPLGQPVEPDADASEGPIASLTPDEEAGPRLVSDVDPMDRPDADADVHSMASAVDGGEEKDEVTDAPEGAGDEWLNDILDGEADEAGKRRDEGEW